MLIIKLFLLLLLPRDGSFSQALTHVHKTIQGDTQYYNVILTIASESITVQHKARVTRAEETAHSVTTHLITATIVSQTLVDVCKRQKCIVVHFQGFSYNIIHKTIQCDTQCTIMS